MRTQQPKVIMMCCCVVQIIVILGQSELNDTFLWVNSVFNWKLIIKDLVKYILSHLETNCYAVNRYVVYSLRIVFTSNMQAETVYHIRASCILIGILRQNKGFFLQVTLLIVNFLRFDLITFTMHTFSSTPKLLCYCFLM